MYDRQMAITCHLDAQSNSNRELMRTRILLAALGAVAVASTSCKKSDSPIANPPAEAMNERAPDTVRVRFETTKGPFVVEAYRAWAPHGVDRFYQLVKMGFYNDTRFFRVIGGFMAQFGVSGDPGVTAAWQDRSLPDDPVGHTNERGTVTFAAKSAPNSRTTQLFISYRDNSNLDASGFSPIGKVIEGMSVVDSLYSGYGEGAPDGNGPDQMRATAEGNTYLDAAFPKLDRITKAELITSAKP
jgi:peptidyl-prolyl cis-trans isomerase A (cyclophilin A)